LPVVARTIEEATNPVTDQLGMSSSFGIAD
jgi:hypothetical protein